MRVAESLIWCTIFSLSVAGGGLQTVLFVHLRSTVFLVSLISCFILASLQLFQIVRRLLFGLTWLNFEFWFQVVISGYYIVSGIVLNCHSINNRLDYSFGKFSMFKVINSCLFIVCILFITISFFIQFSDVFTQGVALDLASSTDSEKSVRSEKHVAPINASSFQFQPTQYTTNAISKKLSEQTLVEPPNIIIDDATDIASLIKNTVDRQNEDNSVLESCLTENWMDSGTKLNYSTFTRPPIQKQKTLAYKMNDLKHAYSMPNFKLPSIRDISISSKNWSNEIDPSNVNATILPLQTPDRRNSDVPERLHTVIQEESANVQQEYILMEANQQQNREVVKTEKMGDDYVKRSKSTSCIGDPATRLKKRQERWRSINDEKVFLSTVNESLLPSVLKRGESPIMESKRRQSVNYPRDVSPSPIREKVRSDLPDKREPETIQIVEERELEENSGILPENDLEEEEDLDNLPYISEFSEPIDQSEFKNFDQGLSQEYKETDIKAGLPNLSYYEEEDTDYNCVLNGLEAIPHGSKFSWVKKSKSTNGYNNISLQDWDDNAQLYHQRRIISGASLALGGGADTLKNEVLALPVNIGFDIDSLHDMDSNDIDINDMDEEKGKFTYANRSYSAPSLHTFRKVSNSSKASTSQVSDAAMNMNFYSNLNLNLNLTGYEEAPQPYTPPVSSPIKKFFQESPKRITSVFKRTSFLKSSEEKHISGHQHTTSIISNAFSLASATTSRSNSPKKSMKSFVTSKSSHKKSVSINSIAWTKPQISEPTNYREYTSGYYDMDATPTSDQSRISSVPSGVIGEYDREKWRTLQALQNNMPVEVLLIND